MLLVDKPAGPTSHDVVAAVRRAFQTRRVGHTGTLDPFATGLLIVLVGRATRLAQYLVGLPKEYTGVVRLGMTTTTDDHTGEPLHTSDTWSSLSDADIREAMQSFIGQSVQRPPRYSAKSVDGKRAYERARRGEDFELEPQAIRVEVFELLSRSGPDLSIRTSVESGVYIRSLARDLGERLRCGAHLSVLRRTSVGRFQIADAVTLDDITGRRATIRPARDAVAHLAQLQIDDPERAFVRQGRAIPAKSGGTGLIALLSGNNLVAVAESDGAMLQPSVVLEN
jgi:tRNA pseudouridine55 synthase